ncbi:MAG TPA: T9SS type A sorting domain-containing protein [Chitinophagales bacterium]|nr:T9SS type A sorting domain-containing protein [Chitinophagales bacterium]
MKKVILFLIIMYFYTSSQAQYPTLLWTNKIQAITQSNPYCNIREIVVDAEGSVYAAGSFTDSLRLDKNPPFTTAAGDESSESAFFAKYNKDGILLWHRVIKGGYLLATDISLDKFNNVYIAGQAVTGAAIDFDPGTNVANLQFDGNDFYFAKYDANGNYVWAKTINVGNGNNSFENKMHTIYVDSSMNIYLAGQFQNTLDIDPDATTVTLANPGGSNCNCTVGFYAKYNNSGSLLWGRADTRNAAIRDLHVHDATGRIALAGERSTNFGTPFRLVSAAGAGIDSLSGGRIISTCARFDAAGNVYYSGYFSSSNNDFDWGNGTTYLSSQATYENVGFTAKYNSTSQFQWVRAYSPTNDTSYRAAYYEVNIAPDGNPLLSFSESNGNNVIKGFYKVNAVNGNEIWSPSAFNIWVGGTLSSNAIPSPGDGSFVFSCDVGFNGSGSNSTFDFHPDPQITTNLAGTGYWSAFVKYGDCINAPSQPGAINGPSTICTTDAITYSIPVVANTLTYTWYLPAGWVGSSDSASITVQPATNGGAVIVSADNRCGSSTWQGLTVSYDSATSLYPVASDTTVCAGTAVTLYGAGANTYSWSNSVTNNIPFIPLATTTYYVTGTSGACTAVDSITINVLQPSASALNATICSGQSYLFNTVELTNVGVYRDTLLNAAGCDSIITLTLIVNQPTGSSINASVCPGQGYPFDGHTLIVPGVYYDTLTNAAGCDSIVILTLTFRQPTSSAFTAAICPGQSYLFNGINRTTAGVYRDTLVNAVGCDSIITLTLSLKQNSSSVFSTVICPSETYFFNGAERNVSGAYRDTLVNSAGCDSIVTLNLTVLPSEFTTLQASICAGSVYQFGAQQLTTAGTYTDTLTAFNGCDSIITLTLTVSNLISSSLSASICAGQTYIFNGQELGTSGSYSDTLQAVGGCDSIITLLLQVDSAPNVTVSPASANLCQNDSLILTASGGTSYMWSNNAISSSIHVSPQQTTTYTVTATGGNTCTTTTTILVNVNTQPSPPEVSQHGDTLLASSGTNHQWFINNDSIDGATESILVITQDGIYYVQVADTNGCTNRSAEYQVIGLTIRENFSPFLWSMYPNPTDGLVYIKCPDCHTAFNYEVYGIQGNLISRSSVVGLETVLDTHLWPAGAYLVRVYNGVYNNTDYLFKH